MNLPPVIEDSVKNQSKPTQNFRYAFDIDGYYMGLVRPEDGERYNLSTDIEPPFKQGFVPRFDNRSSHWIIEPRGERAIRRDFQAEIVDKVGDIVQNFLERLSKEQENLNQKLLAEVIEQNRLTMKTMLDIQSKHIFFVQGIHADLMKRYGDTLHFETNKQIEICKYHNKIISKITQPWYSKLYQSFKAWLSLFR